MRSVAGSKQGKEHHTQMTDILDKDIIEKPGFNRLFSWSGQDFGSGQEFCKCFRDLAALQLVGIRKFGFSNYLGFTMVKSILTGIGNKEKRAEIEIKKLKRGEKIYFLIYFLNQM